MLEIPHLLCHFYLLLPVLCVPLCRVSIAIILCAILQVGCCKVTSRATRLIVLVADKIALVCAMSAVLCSLTVLIVLVWSVMWILLAHIQLVSEALVASAIYHAMRVKASMALRVHAVREV